MPERVPPLLREIIDTVADPIFVKDEAHNWILVNEALCRFMGHPRESLLGKSDFDFFSEEEARVFWEVDDEVFRSGQTTENEERFTGADGKTRIISTKKSLFLDSDGRKVLVGVIRDLTEVKHNEQRLTEALALAEAASKTKSRFLANVSHELRTPLNGIMGMADLLLDHDTAAETREQVLMLKESADHLLHLVNDILDFAAVEQNRPKPVYTSFSLEKLLRGLESMFEPARRSRKIDFCVDGPSAGYDYLLADVHRIRQILVNLIGNAVKFSEDGGRVKLSVRLRPVGQDRLELDFAVSDTGPGIPADKIEQIFQPFVKLGSSHGGTGLGLAIVDELVQLLGGTIKVESQVGRGSRFQFRLCVEQADETKPLADSPPVENQPNRTFDAKVLVVEDDPVSRKVAAFTLKKLGCAVLTAEHGLEALDLLQEHRVDLILLDCQMPHMDGYHFCQAFRLHEKANGAQKTPVVALTAHALEHERQRCLEAGMDEWLTKPLLRDRLVETMARFLLAKRVSP